MPCGEAAASWLISHCTQDLLSSYAGLGGPGRSYPSRRKPAWGELGPPRKCDGRGAGAEDQTEIGPQIKTLHSPRKDREFVTVNMV